MPNAIERNFNIGNSYWLSSIKDVALRCAYDMSYAGRLVEAAYGDSVAPDACEVLVLSPVTTNSGPVAIFQQDNKPDEVLSYRRIQ